MIKTLSGELMKPLPQFPLFYKLLDRFVSLFAFRTEPIPRETVKSIVVFESHLIGDVVMTEPLLRFLCGYFPEAHILLVAGPWAKPILTRSGLNVEHVPVHLPWLQRHPLQMLAKVPALVKDVLKLRRMKPDLFIENRGDVRNILIGYASGATHRMGYDFTCGSGLLTHVINDDGVRKHLIDYNLNIAREFSHEISRQEFIPALLASHETGNVASFGIHLGASQDIRRPTFEQSTCIIEQLVKSHGSKAVMYIDDASAESLQIVDFIQSRWKQDIEIFCGDIDGMIDRISGLDHLLCLDSGPAHIAAALGVKLTMIYGPSDEKFTQPDGNYVEIIKPVGLACAPCNAKTCGNSIHKLCYRRSIDAFNAKISGG